jgi:acyl carrier protein phosphodiesterase
MNWLAHLHLCPPTSADRVGNLLPDLVGGSAQRLAHSRYQPGITLHRWVDKYTDAHPAVRRSITSFPPPWRRFGGVLTDLFYDHFLSLHWSHFSSQDRLEFIQSCYADFEAEKPQVPAEAAEVLRRMQEHDWLGSYISRDGIHLTLLRITARLRREIPLADSMAVLDRNFGQLEQDFLEFYPQLMTAVSAQALGY